MWVSRVAIESLIAALRAENSDLRQYIRDREAKWAEKEQILIDRVLALSAPGALREVRRTPLPPQPAPAESGQERRLHFPGRSPNLRPPSPSSPPQVAGMSPLEKAEVAARRTHPEDAA